METEEYLRRQCEFLTQVQSNNVSPVLFFLLGVCHARTGIEVHLLYKFLQEVENSMRQCWITIEERQKIDLQCYLGALGNARALLSEFKSLEAQGPSSKSCSLCAEPLPMEPVFSPSAACGHSLHVNCAQKAVRKVMLQGGSPELLCPCEGCFIRLSKIDLERLFTVEDYQILYQFWMQPAANDQCVPVLCPAPACKASTAWKRGQFFVCKTCSIKFCLKCLGWQPSTIQAHQCRPYSAEQVAVGELFAKGNRFKVCGKCGYWCDLTDVQVAMCRCGHEICSRCFHAKNECECDTSLLEKLLTFPAKLLD